MITDPDSFPDGVAEAGSTSFLVHWEGNNNLHCTVERTKALGKRAGVANIAGSRSGAGDDCKSGLRASATLLKIRRIAQMIERIKPDCELEVDGELMRRLLQ